MRKHISEQDVEYSNAYKINDKSIVLRRYWNEFHNGKRVHKSESLYFPKTIQNLAKVYSRKWY